MATNIDNLKSQMRKGMLEFCVLLLLQHSDAYASEIIAKMKNAHMIVMEGTLYPLLTRLKNEACFRIAGKSRPRGLHANITASHLSGRCTSTSSKSRGAKYHSPLIIYKIYNLNFPAHETYFSHEYRWPGILYRR